MTRSWAPVFAAILMLGFFSGCVANDASTGTSLKQVSGAKPSFEPGKGYNKESLTQPIYGVLPKTRHYLTAAVDRIQLYNEVFLPDGPGPWPAILINSPYYDHGLNANLDVESTFRSYFVPRGYAVVVADVRGTGYSEGCMNMMGAKEQRDTYDLVEWIANQTWSDGKVGMYGVSYVGTTPHEALIMAPPHLVTVATVAGVTNQWRNMYQNGVPYQGRSYPLTYELIEGAPPPGDADRGQAWARNVAAGGCEQEEMIEHVTPPTYPKGVYDDYWLERNFTLHAHKAKASLFYNQGFTDRAVNPMEAIHWYNELPVPKKSFWGQWAHAVPQRKDWQPTLNAWFDYWLKGIKNGIMDTPPVEIITNDKRIRIGHEWPPADAENLRLYLSAGKLAEAAPAPGRETYTADNANRLTDPRADPVQSAAQAGRRTYLQYETAPLDHEVYMAGIPWASLRASVNSDNTYFLLGLYDVNGPVWTEIAEGWMNAHLWKSFDTSSPLTPNQPYTFGFKFEPREYAFAEGHKIGIVIKGHDTRVFPFDKPVTENTVLYGAEDGSFVDLPVLSAPGAFPRPDEI